MLNLKMTMYIFNMFLTTLRNFISVSETCRVMWCMLRSSSVHFHKDQMFDVELFFLGFHVYLSRPLGPFYQDWSNFGAFSR